MDGYFVYIPAVATAETSFICQHLLVAHFSFFVVAVLQMLLPLIPHIVAVHIFFNFLTNSKFTFSFETTHIHKCNRAQNYFLSSHFVLPLTLSVQLSFAFHPCRSRRVQFFCPFFFVLKQKKEKRELFNGRCTHKQAERQTERERAHPTMQHREHRTHIFDYYYCCCFYHLFPFFHSVSCSWLTHSGCMLLHRLCMFSANTVSSC